MECRLLSLARFIKGYYRPLILLMAHFDSLTKLQDCPLLTFGVIDEIKTILIVYRWSQLTNQELITSNTSIQGYKIAYKKRILQTFRPHPWPGLQKSICKAEFVNHGHKSVRFGLSVFKLRFIDGLNSKFAWLQYSHSKSISFSILIFFRNQKWSLQNFFNSDFWYR